MIMVQKHQLANADPPSLRAILNKFLNFNNTVHFGRNIDAWPHEILSEFSEALENNPELCFEAKDRETIHALLVREAHSLAQNASHCHYTPEYAFSEACIKASHSLTE